MDKRTILTVALLLAILAMPVTFSGPLAGLDDAKAPDHRAAQLHRPQASK
jgi:hypothetical protein